MTSLLLVLTLVLGLAASGIQPEAAIAAPGSSGGPVTSSDPRGVLTIEKTADTYELPQGGGQVTYTYKLRNNSATSILYQTYSSTAYTMRDDKCTNLEYGTGWNTTIGYRWIRPQTTATLACTQNLTQTTTNTFTVGGWRIQDDRLGASTLPTTQATATVTVQAPQADLTVTKAASTSTVPVGGTVNWTLTVRNSGSATSSAWTLTDAVPGHYSNVTTSTAGCSVSGNRLTCANQAGLGAGASKIVTLSAKAATAGQTTNTATISGTSGESDTSNNTSSADTRITGPADLTITKSAEPASAGTGRPVTFSVVVKNAGDTPSSTYTMTDPVPAGWTNVSTSTSGCSVSGNTVTCANQPALAGGASKTFTISAVAPTTEGSATNTARITGTTGENTANNTTSVTVPVKALSPDYKVTKTVDRPKAAVGDALTFTIKVENIGTAPGFAYTLTDAVPTQFTSVASPDCQVTDQVAACKGDGLLPGDSQTFTVTARAGTVLGSFANTASVQDPNDANRANDEGSATVEILKAVAGSKGEQISADGYLGLTKTASTYNLPAGGGQVTYTYTLRNRSNTYRQYWNRGSSTYGSLVDDKCSAVSSPSTATGWAWDGIGYYLAPGASARLTCVKRDLVTTTNTATAKGLLRFGGSSTYYGQTGSVSAQATVVVEASKPLTDPATLGIPAFSCTTTTVLNGSGTTTQLAAQTQGSTRFTNIGKPWSGTYNAMAYRRGNGFVYGVSQDTHTWDPADRDQLVAIDASGGVTKLGQLQLNPDYTSQRIPYGSVTGNLEGRDQTITTYGQAWRADIYGGINFGFFDDTGTYWIGNASKSGSGVIYEVDLTSGYVTPLANQSAAVRSNDLAYTEGFAWGIQNDSNTMIRVDLASGKVQAMGAVAGLPQGTYGAAWTYTNGNLGFDINTGGVYQIDVINGSTSSPSFQLIATSAGPASSNNDGTACTGKPVDLAIAKTGSGTVSAGGSTTWDLTVTNKSKVPSSGFTVTDIIPDNFTYRGASWAGGTCTYDSATRKVTCVSTGQLAPGDTSTIRITTQAGSANQCYTNTGWVLGNEADPNHANDTSTWRTCVGAGQPMTCDRVMYGSLYTQSATSGSFGTVVSGSGVKGTITDQQTIPSVGFQVPGRIGTYYANQTSAMAIDTLDPNYIYYGARVMDTFLTNLFRYDQRTKKVETVGASSSAWSTNRMAIQPDGTIWSFANDGHLYSYHPTQGGAAPTDWGIAQSPESDQYGRAINLDFTKFRSGDIAFDGTGNMWILASNNATTYLITISAAQLGQTKNPVATMVGIMNSPTEGYYNGIAFGSDGTLYASSIGGSYSYLHTVNPDNGETKQVQRYLVSGTGQFGDLGSCADPKPDLSATKTVRGINADGSAMSGPLTAGDLLEYTVSVANGGNLAATGVEMIDELPEGVQYVAGTTTLNGKAKDDTLGSFPYAGWEEVHGSLTEFQGVVPAKDKAVAKFRVKIAETFTGNQLCNQGRVRYTSRELDGLILSDDLSTPGKDDPTCIPVVPPQKTITVEKQGTFCDVGQDTCPLTGAQFAIHDTDPSSSGAAAIVDGIRPDRSGSVFTSTKLDVDRDYWLVETKAPAGFNLLPTPIRFRIEVDPDTEQWGVHLVGGRHGGIVTVDDANALKLIVKDTSPVRLPAAGGPGPWPFLAAGLGLLLAAAYAAITQTSGPRRRTQRSTS